MREILTEFDELQEAMKKINLNEEVMPIYAGKVLINENAESYKKMQQILDCDEMRSAHKYLLNLNPEQMSEEEMDQVDKIFQLGVNRGFIDVNGDHEVEQAEVDPDVSEPKQTCCKAQKPTIGKVKIPCWTVMYSAFKNGEIKTGECYSNSIDARSAKADCLAKLARCGYDNVSILALEQGDPDNCGFDDYGCNEEEKVEENDILKNRNHNNHIAEDEDLEEDDMLKSRPSNGAKHNGHIEEAEDDEDPNEHNAITGRLMNGRQRNSVDELADLPGEDDEDVEEAEQIDEYGHQKFDLSVKRGTISNALKKHIEEWTPQVLQNQQHAVDVIKCWFDEEGIDTPYSRNMLKQIALLPKFRNVMNIIMYLNNVMQSGAGNKMTYGNKFESDDSSINEGTLGDYVLTFEISDIDPETFLKGHVDQWIEDTLAKNPKVKIDKIGQTDVGVQVKVTGPYEQLEQIYADYLKYDDLYDFEKSPNDFDEFKASLEKVAEAEDQIEESGNPYVAGMKTTDINGATVINGSKPKKAAAPKKEKIEEDDEDSGDDSEEDSKEEEKVDNSSDEGSEESNDEGSDDSEDEGSDDEGSDDDSGEDESTEDDDTEGSDDSEDEGSDDSEEDTEEDTEEDSDEESDDSESDDDSDEDSEDDSGEEESDSDDGSEEDEDSEDEDDSEDEGSDDSEEDAEEDSKDDEEKKEELSDEEKANLKNDYKKAFKEVLFKCKFDDLCFDDLTIEQKVKFFTELGKKWKKNEPKDFMTDKEIEQLNKVVAKK